MSGCWDKRGKELVRSERSLEQCLRDSVWEERRGLEKRDMPTQPKEDKGWELGSGGVWEDDITN